MQVQWAVVIHVLVMFRQRFLVHRPRYHLFTKKYSLRPHTPEQPSVIQEHFISHTLYAINAGNRFLKFSFFGLIALGTTIAAAFEGAHLYVEHVGMAPESDPEVKKWEWDESWSGDSAVGGTDPALGIRARHTVRAAWMAYNWGVGYSAAATGTDGPFVSSAEGLTGPAGIHVIDAQMQRTEDFLRSAIHVAETTSSPPLHPLTFTTLLARHAAVLEKLGSGHLEQSKLQYERAWQSLPMQQPTAARIAMKLGNLNARLGQDTSAVDWWAKAIKLTQGESSEVGVGSLKVPSKSPASPLSQRILFSTLVSLSAHYAQRGKLKEAEALEESALALLRSIIPPESFASASPPQSLHALYLLQQSSTLSIHLAEVLHARRYPVRSSVQWLMSAAESSERVARALSGLPLSPPPGPVSEIPVPNPQKDLLLACYNTSRSLNKAADALLKDARRTAAESWNLLGVLYEMQEGSQSKAAFECFNRAVNWAGAPIDDNGSSREAADGILQSDWHIFVSNLERIKTARDQRAK